MDENSMEALLRSITVNEKTASALLSHHRQREALIQDLKSQIKQEQLPSAKDYSISALESALEALKAIKIAIEFPPVQHDVTNMAERAISAGDLALSALKNSCD